MSTSEEKINEVGRTAQENANLIWNAANSLFGAYKPHEYGEVIIPMCVIKRFHDCLMPTHKAVVEANKKYANMGDMKAGFLKKISGYQFYNTSLFTFDTLIADSENIYDNFLDYVNGFSDNVMEILTRMNFYSQIERMNELGVLYQVIVDFAADNLDMSPTRITTVDMGYIFENLVQRFSESYNEEAGAHFTSRDIIYLMCDILTTNGSQLVDEDGLHCTVYDMTMGTSQMLTCMQERLRRLDENADIKTFGQEINPFTMGIAMADTLIHGGDPDNMRFGDTLSDDKFSGYKFDYVISNPPFGIDWKREAQVVENEHKKGELGRFAPGLPAKNDGQMLFMLNGLAKLKENSGKMAIIQNASSLFGGDAGSGQSEIRAHLIKNDWLDAIIQLPMDSFYNTPIATYVWVIDKSKPFRNPGKIQLIDATGCCVPRYKAIGSKRVDINEKCRDMIVKIYGEYITNTVKEVLSDGTEIICKSKVMDSYEFGYWKVVIEKPQYDLSGKKVMKKGNPVPDAGKRDTENIPMVEDIDEYMEREIRPFAPDAWIDYNKTKEGYEIPMTRIFYEYEKPETLKEIEIRINNLEKEIEASVKKLFRKEAL